MNFPLLIGILVLFVAVQPQLSSAIKCFRCATEQNCADNNSFQSESQSKYQQFVEECQPKPNYIPACTYVVDKDAVVHERRCDYVGVTSRVTFCTDRFNDAVCHCTSDWCNGIDSSNTAVEVAKRHFAAQAEQTTTPKNSASHLAPIALSFAAMLMMVLFN